MIILILLLISSCNSQRCRCSEIFFKDRCQSYRGCFYNFQQLNCQEIPCQLRSKAECPWMADRSRCAWNLQLNLCAKIDSCSELNESSTHELSQELCLQLKCGWNYAEERCIEPEEAKTCTQYSLDVCTKASISVELFTYPCVLNGPNGERCNAFRSCEYIEYEPSCDSRTCLWKDGRCVSKQCSDYELTQCPTVMPNLRVLCYSGLEGCMQVECSYFKEQINCNTHPACFWGQSTNRCERIDCSTAITKTQCNTFSSNYGLQECRWNGNEDACQKCWGLLLSAVAVASWWALIS